MRQGILLTGGLMIELMPDMALADGFWYCECSGNDYIHPLTEARCPRCGAARDDQPSSRLDEVVAAYRAAGRTGELLACPDLSYLARCVLGRPSGSPLSPTDLDSLSLVPPDLYDCAYGDSKLVWK